MTDAKNRRLRKTAIAIALGGMLAGGSPLVLAQSTTVGSIFGQVASEAGATVTLKNVATGLERTVQIGADGRFQSLALPPGHYIVTLQKENATVSTVELDVLAGRGSEAVFSAAGKDQIEEVVVMGRAPAIDVSTTNNGSVFTAKQIDALPISSKDLNGIIGLAANTVSADYRYEGGISIGGGGPSENAYYINGFPVTNPLTQLGSMELPFGAIQQAQVQTGGFGAEFGRSVGGVVNITTKSGTNEWHGGVQASIAPDSLRSSPRNIYYPDTGEFDETDGTIYYYREKNKRSETFYGGYVGGPIVKDKLFMFLAADLTNLKTESVNSTPDGSGLSDTGWRKSDNNNTRYLGKLDWYITDNHRLEATLLGDNYKTTDDYFGYDYATHSKTDYSYTEKSKNLGNTTPGVGGDAQIIKYIGNVTDDLLVTAMYGQSKYKHEDKYTGAVDLSQPEIYYTSTTAAMDPRIVGSDVSMWPTAANVLPAGTDLISPGAEETTKSFRLDVEYKLFDHMLRAGIDENRLESKNAGTAYPPGGYYRYYRYTSDRVASGPVYGGQTTSFADAGATPDANGYYYAVRSRVFNTVTDAESNQSAQYIEDRWQVTNNVLLTLGLRNEQFENKNGDGQTFLKMDNFLSPRLAAAWDVMGDSSMKVFGSAGRYSLQIPTHVAVRGASRSLYTDQYFVYTGIDPDTAAPTGLTALGDPYSGNNEYGQAKDPKSVAAQDMDPTYQDEITLGFEKSLMPSLTAGASMTYRKLKATIDDFCDYRPIEAYAAAHMNGDPTNDKMYDLSQADFYPFGCATINPGESNTIYIDADGNDDDGDGVDQPAVPYHLTAADIGLPKPKRTYLALDFFLEHPFSNGWYGKVTYTWAKSRGNTEGQTKSDNGQSDVAVTSTWDFPELMENSNGYLPNDRRHSIKAYGYYQITPEWFVGANLLAESGRPKNCFGDYNGTGEDIGGGAYGGVFFYCGGEPAPRGSAGRLPWSYRVDANVMYKPEFAKGVSVRADVFNLFNRQSIQTIEEEHDSVAYYGGDNPTYGRVRSYTAPRFVRLTVGYEF